MKQNQEGEEKPQPHSAKANSSPKFILTSEENKRIEEQSEQSSSAAWLQMQPKDTEASARVNTGSGSSEIGKNKNTQSDKSVGRKKGFSQGSRRNFQANQDPRVTFETFDSSLEEKKDEKLVFKYIQRMDFPELKQHLENSKDKYDLLTIYDKSGYTPIHYAAYKNIDKAVEILIKFVLSEEEEENAALLNGGSGDTGDIRDEMRRFKTKKLKTWINTHSRGDDGFTALHFAAFHGNMAMIRLLVSHGANLKA